MRSVPKLLLNPNRSAFYRASLKLFLNEMYAGNAASPAMGPTAPSFRYGRITHFADRLVQRIFRSKSSPGPRPLFIRPSSNDGTCTLRPCPAWRDCQRRWHRGSLTPAILREWVGADNRLRLGTAPAWDILWCFVLPAHRGSSGPFHGHVVWPLLPAAGITLGLLTWPLGGLGTQRVPLVGATVLLLVRLFL